MLEEMQNVWGTARSCLHQLLRQGHRCSLGTDEQGWYWRKGTPAPDAFPVDDAPIGRLFQADPLALASLIRRETRPLAKLAYQLEASPHRLALDFHESGRGIVAVFGQDRVLIGPFL